MRWRYVILGILLAVPTAGVIQLWPPIPAYRIPGANRKYLADARSNRELLFLVFDSQSDEPPVIERRAASSGGLLASTPLEWAKMSILVNRRHETLISADRTTFVWLQEISEFAASKERCRGAAFDTITGQLLGDVFICEDIGYCYLSPNVHWLMIFRGIPTYRLVIHYTTSGKSHHEIPAPNEFFALLHGCFSPHSKQALFQ